MPLITAQIPERWQDLESLIAAILNEAGLKAQRTVTLALPRGSVDVDVLAEEAHDGITHRITCECKNWSAKIPREVVHAFRTVVLEAGAHRGYVISRAGFQPGALDAAQSTNIELVTFSEFQNIFFTKWYNKQLWDIENDIGDFNTYYEPLGPPGYANLADDAERAAYDAVWSKYHFAGMMLLLFSPYMRQMWPDADKIPPLPFDVTHLEAEGIEVPADIRMASGYRELFSILREYARTGLRELRGVNPITRNRPVGEVTRDD